MQYLSQNSHQELYTFMQTKWQCFLSVLLYFTLTEVSAKYSSLVILTHSLNKQSFLIKCVNDLAFYNYSSVL